MNLSWQKKYIIAIVLQIVLLFGLVMFKTITYTQGKPIFLRILPIDPRDPLRGDYVTLRFEINEIHDYGYNRNITEGQTVYVPLYKYDKFWQSNGSVVTELPQNTSGSVYLKGIVTRVTQADTGITTNPDGTPITTDLSVKSPPPFYNNGEKVLTIQYGIEQYFIPENSGHQGDLNRAGDPYALVMVDKDGKAITKTVYINDQPWP